uniref:Uncharacterized protein n=1 Tax=Rhizophora mucronata TaxID=61149 RepID=A0A2P2R450_RHIMU
MIIIDERDREKRVVENDRTLEGKTKSIRYIQGCGCYVG